MNENEVRKQISECERLVSSEYSQLVEHARKMGTDAKKAATFRMLMFIVVTVIIAALLTAIAIALGYGDTTGILIGLIGIIAASILGFRASKEKDRVLIAKAELENSLSKISKL